MAAPPTEGSVTTTVPHPPAASPPTSHADAGTLIRLPVKGFDDAWVAIPKSGTGPRPIAIAAHANWDRAIWECRWWRRLLPDMFLLCPFGILRSDSPSPDDPRYTFADDKALEAEVDAGLAALRARFGTRLNSTAPMLWVGLSRGAYLGAKIAARRPAHFPQMILAEGGHDPWTGPNAKAYAQGGVRRILFVCGQGACTVLAKKAARTLQHFGVETKRIDVPRMGHGISADADKPILAALPWLLSRSP